MGKAKPEVFPKDLSRFTGLCMKAHILTQRALFNLVILMLQIGLSNRYVFLLLVLETERELQTKINSKNTHFTQ